MVIAAASTAFLSLGVVISVLPPFIRGDLHSSDTAVGIVMGSLPIAAVILRLVGGSAIDRRGPRPFLILGLLLCASSSVLYAIADSPAALIPARVVHGAGESVVFTAGIVWVLALTPSERRGQVIGLYGLCVWSGLSVGPPVGDLLARNLGRGAVWTTVAIAPLAGASLVCFVRGPKLVPAERSERAVIARGALVPGMALGLAAVGAVSLLSFGVLLLRDRGLAGGGGIIAVYAAATAATRIFAGKLPDRLGGFRTALVGCAFGAAGPAVLAVAHSFPVAALGAALGGIAWGLIYPGISLLVLSRVPDAQRAAGFATIGVCWDLAFGLGSVALGVVADLTSYGVMFAVASLVVLTSIPALVGSRHARELDAVTDR